MNISKVCVNLTGKDILSIVNDFVHVKGLILDEVIINNNVLIKGSFTKGLKINFEATIDELGVENGKIIGRFSKLKVYKLGIFKVFRSLALKIGLKAAGDIGIDATKDRLTVDIDQILEKVPFVKVSVEEAYIKGNVIVANVNDITVNIGEIINKFEKDEVSEKEEAIEKINSNDIVSTEALGLKDSVTRYNKEYIDEEIEELIEEKEILEIKEVLQDTDKKDDYYSVGRNATKEKVENKLPDNAKQYSDYLFLIPDLAALIFRLLKDDRVPLKTKLAVSGSIAYIVCPTDMIPSNIPFIGKIDDLAVLFFALNRIANDVPLKVIVENWSGKNELILVLKSGLDYVSGFTGARNVEKVYNVVEQLSVL